MAEKLNDPIQPQQHGIYYPQVPAPNPNVPMYPLNNMNAPPTYDQATQPYIEPRPMQNVAYTTRVHQPTQPLSQTVQPFAASTTREKVSVPFHCNSCNNEIYTRVNKKVSQRGIFWVILCCFSGIFCVWGFCLLSLFVLCLDGFKVYRHFCPACNVFIGEYSPKMSGGAIALLVFLPFLFVGLQVLAVMMYLKYHN